MVLPLEFYLGADVVGIARAMLGKVLLTRIRGRICSGMIVETEAYSFKEKGSHAYRGLTRRNAVMFGEGGHAYVYLCYGIHQMFNVVTNREGQADAVLVRALQPMEGITSMMRRVKATKEYRITSGPGKLTKALGITAAMNGLSLSENRVWLEDTGETIGKNKIIATPRIGIDYAGQDALLPWRFSLKDNPWISK